MATNILGVSGRTTLNALIAGTTDAQVLAELAKGALRRKIPALRKALQGRFDRHHALWIGAILGHIDFLDEQIEEQPRRVEHRGPALRPQRSTNRRG